MPTTSELASAMPVGDRSDLPDNASRVLPSTPDPAVQQPGHIPIDAGAIDSFLREIPQKPYTKGARRNDVLQIPYFPSGFTVSTAASEDTSEVGDPDTSIPTLDSSPDKKWQLYIEACTSFALLSLFAFFDVTYVLFRQFHNPAYAATNHTDQTRVHPTRGAFAIFAAQEIRKIISKIPNFPYTLDQIKVVSIDVRSKGTVQPRLFVDGFVMASRQENDSLGMQVAEALAANP